MAANDWAHVRLSIQLHPGGSICPGGSCLHWRLEAKHPGDQWNLRSTAGFGMLRIPSQPYPPSRDDALAAMIELLMSMEWTHQGVTLA